MNLDKIWKKNHVLLYNRYSLKIAKRRVGSKRIVLRAILALRLTEDPRQSEDLLRILRVFYKSRNEA
jgi:hypothetical protein